MTSLEQYSRLEALGLWRETATDQRREVVVSLGASSLILTAANGEALGHWSLAAIHRDNPGKLPALYAPAEDTEETLEVAEPEMVDAIDRVCAAIAKSRPRPGRLRLVLAAAAFAGATAAAIFWMPGALTQQTVSLLPEAKRQEIGQHLLGEITAIAGRPCGGQGGRIALARLAARSFGAEATPHLVMLPETIPDTLSLPGNIVIASAALAEDFETPEVLAGFLLAEATRRAANDPIERLLQDAGLAATFRLLTTGDLPAEAIHAHAAQLLSEAGAAVDETALLARFRAAEISSQPYAYAIDVSGETVLPLIEADPMRGRTPVPVLADGDWVSLQEICAG